MYIHIYHLGLNRKITGKKDSPQKNSFFQEKREISRNSHKDYKEGKIDKCKYLNALNSENSIRKVILNLFSRDILQNKLLIHSRHVRLLSEIENFMESIDNLKKNLIN